MRWDPFRGLSDMRENMGEDFFPVDLYETDDEVVVKASLPGVKAEDVEIAVTGDTLTIKGETREEHEEKKPNYYRQERRYGAFQRVLTLPVRVDADKADATFEQG